MERGQVKSEGALFLNKEVTTLPLLHIQPEIYTLGDIKEGESAIATFLIRNNHKQVIELVDIQASCGCTAAAPDSYTILPGSFTQLKVRVDTTAKQHDIKKSITVVDSLGNQSSAILKFNVVENPHRSEIGKIQGIFDGKCASCHFEPLLNEKVGKKIYETGCAMCHGLDGQGAYAPDLRGYASLAALKDVISNGVGKPQMPAFSASKGGPLTHDQIHALSTWLMALPAEPQ